MSTKATLPQQLADFLGVWRVERTINDVRAGRTLHAEGQAEVSFTGDSYIYQEELRLIVPGQAPMTATRSYLWKQAENGVAIHFDDGRYFHHLRLGQAGPSDHHACDPDSYDVRYDFSQWPEWQTTWRVVGPRKDYVMTSHYAATAKSA